MKISLKCDRFAGLYMPALAPLLATAALLAAAFLFLPSRAPALFVGELVFDPAEPRPGDIVRVVTRLPMKVHAGTLTVEGRTFKGFETGGLMTTYIGIDLDVSPGLKDVRWRMGTETGAYGVRVVDREFGKESLKVASSYTNLDPKTIKRVTAEKIRLDKLWKQSTEEKYWSKSFVRPAVGPGGSPFGLRRFFNGQARSPHSGIDIKANRGSEVYASNAGKVVVADDLFFTGNTVVIDHGLGLYTIYAHLSKIQVEEGVMVERAQLLGLVGATGRVTGPHLHWAAKLGGARVDPLGLPGLVF